MDKRLLKNIQFYALRVALLLMTVIITYSFISYVKYGKIDFNVLKESTAYQVTFDEVLKLKKDKLVSPAHFKVNPNDTIFDIKFSNPGFKYLTIHVNYQTTKRSNIRLEYMKDDLVMIQDFKSIREGINVLVIPSNILYDEIRISSKNQTAYVTGVSGIKMDTAFVYYKDILFFSFSFALFIFLLGFCWFRSILGYLIIPVVKLYNDVVKFVMANGFGIAALIFLTLLSFGFLVFNFTLSIDEELELMGPRDIGWVGYGRFGTYFFNKLFVVGEVFTPYFTDFLAAFFLGLASLVFVFNFESRLNNQNRATLPIFIFSGLFISMPLVSGEYMAFGVYNMALGFGYVLVGASISFSSRFIAERGFNNILWAILTLGGAISIYQSFISVYVTCTVLGVLVCILSRQFEINYKKIWEEIFVSAFILVFSVSIYFVLNKHFQSTIAPAYGYIGNIVGWGNGREHIQVLIAAIQGVVSILMGQFDGSGVVILSSTFALIFYFLIKIFGFNNKRSSLIFILFSLAFVLSPFLLMLGLGTTLPGRAMQALPLFMGGAWYLIVRFPVNVVGKRVAVIGAVYLIFIQMQFLNAMLYGDYLRYQHDSFLGRQIILSLERENINYHNKPLVFVGSRQLDASPLISKINSGGKSFFEDASQSYRMTYFINSLGYNVITATYDEMEEGKKRSLGMMSWPKDNSIKEMENMIVVKLSENK